MSAPLSNLRRVWLAMSVAILISGIAYLSITDETARLSVFALIGCLASILILLLLRRSRANEASVQDLMDHASDAIFVVADRRYVDVNEAACDLTGRSREELLAMEVASLDPTDRRDEVNGLFDRLEAGETVIAESDLIRKDGSRIRIEAHARQLPDGRFQSIVRDISERVEAERALRESEELLRHAFDAGASGMTLETLDGRLTKVNPAFANMLGYEPQELEGRSTDSITHADDRDEMIETLDRMARGTFEESHTEKRFLHRTGRAVWARVDLALTRYEQGRSRMVVGHVLDISRSRELEGRLRQGEKMEAVGRLAGGVAHDFNNLLGIVLNYSRFVAEELGPKHACRDDVQEIIKAGQRGTALVHQLLTFSRKDLPNTEALLVNDAVSELEPLLRKLIPENIQLSIQLDPDIPEVAIDQTHLDQILVNLAVNAKDAMYGDGELKIATRNLTLGDPSEDLGLEAGRYAVASVSDTGTGIPQEIREHVFEPFFTTKERDKGTGLGLATVHSIVSQAGGTVHIESIAGLGTRFDIFLPATHVEVQPIRLKPSPAAMAEKTTVLDLLVVEDEPSVRSLTSRILRSAGHNVVEAGDGIEALEILRDVTFDVLVSDVVMPAMSGLELRRRVELPAVLMSGYPDDDIRDQGELPTDTALVLKPFTPDELLEAVSRAATDSTTQRSSELPWPLQRSQRPLV